VHRAQHGVVRDAHYLSTQITSHQSLAVNKRKHL